MEQRQAQYIIERADVDNATDFIQRYPEGFEDAPPCNFWEPVVWGTNYRSMLVQLVAMLNTFEGDGMVAGHSLRIRRYNVGGAR